MVRCSASLKVLMTHRVLHVLPWISSGGVEQRRLQILEHLDPDEFTQRIVCMEHRGAVSERIQRLGIPIDVIPGRWTPFDLDTIASLLAIIEEFDPHIIHGAVFEGVTMASFAGYLGQVPHVIIEETGGTTWRSWKGDLLLAITAMLAERCVAVSPHIARYLSERSQLPTSKIALITNGITLPEPPDSEEVARYRDEIGLPEDALVIGSLGRMYDEVKRFSDILRAFAMIDPGNYSRPVVLLLGGKGPDYDRLRQLARELGVEDRVFMPGYISQPARLYALMDLFVLMSASESFGLVVVEAMSASLPVITSDAGALPDIVDHGETGFVVPIGDTHALRDRMTQLLDAEPQRLAIGEAAREIATTRYSSRRYVRDVEAFYRKTVEQ